MNRVHLGVRWLWTCFVVFLLALTRLASAHTEAAPPILMEQPVPTYQETFNKAYEFLQQGDAARAIVLFEQLLRQRPDASVHYAQSLAYAANQQPELAAGSLERFFGCADAANVPPEVTAEAQRRFADYQRQLSRLGVAFVLPPTAAPAGLYLNGQFAAALQGGAVQPPLWLHPGIYQVMVSASGTRTYQIKLDLVPGESRQLTETLEPDQRPIPLVPGSGASRWRSSKAMSTFRKVLIGTGVAVGTLMVLGIVTVAVVAATSDGSSSHHHHDFD